MKRAWRTTSMSLGITSIVAAETRAQAQAITFESARECYPDIAKWTDIRVVRAPEHDAWAEVDASRCCWGEEHLPARRVGGAA